MTSLFDYVHLVFFVLLITAVFSKAPSEPSSGGNLDDFHQFDCHRCGHHGHRGLEIEHIFQIDFKLYVQLRNKQLANKNVTYQVIDLNGLKHSTVRCDDLFNHDFTSVIAVLDFTSLDQTCEQSDSCSLSQFRSLRHRILAIGYSMTGKVIFKAYHKAYSGGVLTLKPLPPISTATVMKQSRMSSLSLNGVRSAILLNPTGLLLVTYRQSNITVIQSLTDNLLLQQALQISNVMPSDLASSGMFVWQRQLYALDHEGVLSSISVDSLLQRIIEMASTKSSSAFSRFSAEQFFKCNCSSSGKNVRLIGVNNLFAIYRQMSLVNQDLSKNEPSTKSADSKVLQELLHNLKISFYKQMYDQIVSPNNSSQLKLHDFQTCLKNILVNESQMSKHYHQVQLSVNNHLNSDNDVPVVNMTTTVRPNSSNTSNQVELCKGNVMKPSVWWYIALLLIYLLLGAFVFCLMFCCCLCNDGAHKDELYLITGLGTKLSSQINRNPMIQLEDFIYLVSPYEQDAPRSNQYKPSVNLSAGFSINATASKQSANVNLPAFHNSKEMYKSFKSNVEPALMFKHGPTPSPPGKSSPVFDFATSVNVGDDTICKSEKNIKARVISEKLIEKIRMLKLNKDAGKGDVPPEAITLKANNNGD